jgi:hypothetical protein
MRPHFISQKYSVKFDEYAEKRFIKDFKKKYKGNWDATRLSIEDTLVRIANLEGGNQLDIICTSVAGTYLVKFDFKVAKTNMSAKTSGNRCILEVCNQTFKVNVLLVYCKDHIGRSDGQETLWWKEEIENQYNLCCA